MLQDIEKITKNIFNEFIINNCEMAAPRVVYNSYVNLNKVIDDIDLVANHYLSLNFQEDYLQNSSYGTPADKWRMFFNKDLEVLNLSIKEYLLTIYHLGFKDAYTSLMYELYNPKSYYGFVRDQYNVGYVNPCSFELIIQTLSVKCDNETHYLFKHNKIDLTTYEQRLQLQQKLVETKDKITVYLVDIKKYILKNYTIENLL